MSLPTTLRLKQSQPQVFQEQNNEMIPKTLRLKEQSPQFSQKNYISDEDLERDIERNTARSTAQIGQTALGFPGDIASFISGLFGKEQNILPTSHSLKQKSEKLSGGYLSPKNETEKSSDELISDVTSMAIPGTGGYSIARNIGIPVVANLVKEGIKYTGSGDKSQAYGKIGTMIALDLATRNKGGVKKYVNSLFEKAKESIPEGTIVSAGNLEKSLDKLEKTLKMGGSRTTTKKALEKVSEIKNEIKDGHISAENLAAYRPSINEAIDELGGFQSEVPKKFKPAAIKNLNDVKGEVIKTLTEYGEKHNPEFLKYYKDSNEAYAALANSNKIANFIQEKVGYTPQSKAINLLFSHGVGPSAYVGAKLLGTGGGAALAGGTAVAGGYQVFKVLNQIKNSKVLSKYYGNVLKNAIQGNSSQTLKNLKALDVNLKKDED